MKISLVATALAGSLAVANGAGAAPIPYSTPGVENTVTYNFTAASTGHVIAYFSGSTAAYTNDLGLLINGVDTGVHGLNNHSSPYGLAFDFGVANAGDSLIFKLNNIYPGGIGPWYSDQLLNYDGKYHVYSTNYAGDSIIPAGVFVSFEDLPYGGDFNYNDEDFVFTNVKMTVAAPEPATIALFVLGLSGLSLIRRGVRA